MRLGRVRALLFAALVAVAAWAESVPAAQSSSGGGTSVAGNAGERVAGAAVSPAQPRPRRALLSNEVDPQDPSEEDVEWISADELKRRIADAQAAARRVHPNEARRAAARASGQLMDPAPGAAGIASAPITHVHLLPQSSSAAAVPAEAAAVASDGAADANAAAGAFGRGRRLDTIIDFAKNGTENTASMGPAFPVFWEDLPLSEADEAATFAGELVIPTPDPRHEVPLPVLEGCEPAETSGCAAALSTCLTKDISDYDGVICPCYFEYATCFADAGCIELLPKADVDFCFYNMRCSRNTCLGNGAGALAVGAPTVAVAALAVLLLAAPACRRREAG